MEGMGTSKSQTGSINGFRKALPKTDTILVCEAQLSIELLNEVAAALLGGHVHLSSEQYEEAWQFKLSHCPLCIRSHGVNVFRMLFSGLYLKSLQWMIW